MSFAPPNPKHQYTMPVNATEDWDNAQRWAHGLIATHYPNQIADTLCDLLLRAEAAEAKLSEYHRIVADFTGNA